MSKEADNKTINIFKSHFASTPNFLLSLFFPLHKLYESPPIYIS